MRKFLLIFAVIPFFAYANDVPESVVLTRNETQGLKTEDQIEIFSDELHYFPKDGIAIFQGNVKAYQKDMELGSNEMTVFIEGGKNNSDSNELPKDSKINKVELKGNVIIITPEEQATSSRGEYLVETGIATLYENVKLLQDKSWITGDRFVHNRNTGESLMYSTSKAKRVKGYFAPKEEGND